MANPRSKHERLTTLFENRNKKVSSLKGTSTMFQRLINQQEKGNTIKSQHLNDNLGL